MNMGIKRVLFWTPRVLCILFAIFLSLFSLDVFSEGYGFWETILALLIHLVPVYIVVIALVIAWRWEWVGASLFITLDSCSVTTGCSRRCSAAIRNAAEPCR